MKQLFLTIQDWFDHLNKRERAILSVAAAACVLVLIYSVFWRPVAEDILKTENKIEQKMALSAWLSAREPFIRQLQQQTGVGSNKSLTEQITASASTYQLDLSRIQPGDESLQVWLDNAAFDQLIRWFHYLKMTGGVQIDKFSATRIESEPGLVKAQVTFR